MSPGEFAYTVYCQALHLTFPLPWERIPAGMRDAWEQVYRAVETRTKEGAIHADVYHAVY